MVPARSEGPRQERPGKNSERLGIFIDLLSQARTALAFSRKMAEVPWGLGCASVAAPQRHRRQGRGL